MPSNQMYPARNYALGSFLLTLRNRTKLTQTEFAAELGVHRRSIQKWESGETAPSPERLRALIQLCLTRGAFTPTQEYAEASGLWQRVRQASAHQFPEFDQTWFEHLLQTLSLKSPTTSTEHGQTEYRPDPSTSLSATEHGRLYQPTSLVGRADELAEIAEILRDPTRRLLTLHGPGGIGKTRLASAVAVAHSHLFRHGSTFVSLATLEHSEQLADVIRRALPGAIVEQEVSGLSSTQQLLMTLRDQHLLLVLDDFEHLLDGTALLYQILAEAPLVTLLVTSRTRLNLQAEWLFDVAGLSYPSADQLLLAPPQSLADLDEYSATQLFVQRALQVQPRLVLSPANLLAIAHICRHVAGMPLAIELAVSSLRTLSIGELEAQIRSNLDSLATTLRDVPPRHRSLRAVFDHSWKLLSEPEQIILSRLAIFQGGWDEAAAQAICTFITEHIEQTPESGQTWPLVNVTFSSTILAALVDKALIQRLASTRAQNSPSLAATGQPRFVLLPALREYALEKLAERDEAALLQQAHAVTYLGRAQAVAEQWNSPQVDQLAAQWDADIDNFRVILQWASAGGDVNLGLQLAGALTKFWQRRGQLNEGRLWLETLLDLQSKTAEQTDAQLTVRLQALEAAARLATHQYDFEQASQWFEQSMVLRETLGKSVDDLLLDDTLTAKSSKQTTIAQRSGRVDWGLAQDVGALYGRDDELATLTDWVTVDQCRVIILVGMGGIGKTSLAITFARQVIPQFDRVIFRSLGEAPPLMALLDQLMLGVDVEQQINTTSFSEKLALLLTLLRRMRVLLILDNLETLFAAEATNASYLPGYEQYGTLFKTIGETAHQSCLILTSRERPQDLAGLEGPRQLVRSLPLVGLSERASQLLLAEQDLLGSPGDAAVLAQTYAGNPLALKLIADPIRTLFQGDIATFLTEGNLFFNGVGHLLTQQIERASTLERTLLTWLAIGREPLTLTQLLGDLNVSHSRSVVLGALHALWRRNLVELGQAPLTFTLQRVVAEYLTEYLIEQAQAEILRFEFETLSQYALIQATAKEYVRHSQERLVAAPLLQQLTASLGTAEMVADHLLALLDACRAAFQAQPVVAQGYLPGNVINLLRLLRGELRRLDLAHLAIRQAYLQGAELQDTSLAGSLVRNSMFTETFDALTAVTVSNRGNYWAAISRRGELLVWAADSQILQRTWQAHTSLAWTLCFSPDGTLLASGGWDGNLKLWDVETGTLCWLGRHTNQINRVAFAPDGKLLASAGGDAVVQLWDVQQGESLQTLAHSGPVSVVVWSPDGHSLVSSDLEGTIRLWARQTDGTFAYVDQTPGHTTWTDGLAFAPDGQTLVSASYDGTVKLWAMLAAFPQSTARDNSNATWIRLRQTIDTQPTRVHRIVWSPDGRILAGCSFERTIWLWDHEQKSYLTPLQGHTASVYDLAFTPDGRSLLSGSQDGTLRIWDVATGQCTRVIESYIGSLHDVDWSPDGKQLVSVGTDGLVTVYTAIGGTQDKVLRGHMNVIFGVGWSANGRWLASSEVDNIIRLWEVDSGNCFQVLQHPDDEANHFYGIAWSPDGRRLASGTSRRGIFVWDVAAQRPSWRGEQFLDKIRHVAWSPDGSQLVSGGDNGTVSVWDATSGVLLRQFTGHRSMVSGVAWSLDGELLAAAGRGQNAGKLLIWATQSGELIHGFSGHAEYVSAVAWSATSEILVSGGGGGKLRWWHLPTGEILRTVEAHQGAIQSLRRSPDGTKLASCGDDGTIKLWDLASGAYLQTLRRDRPYERLDITGINGITEAQRASLVALGAVARAS